MGYVRQSMALSFILFFNYFFINKKYLLSFILIILAIASHKTSIIYFFFVIFCTFFLYKNLRQLKFIIPIAILSLFFLYFYQVDIFRMTKVYLTEEVMLSIDINQKLSSTGIIFKAPILLFFVCIYYFFFKDLKFINKNEKLIFNSFIFLIIIPLPFLGYFSSFVDRIFVYCYVFIPLLLNKIFNSNVFRNIKTQFLFQLFLIIFSFLTLITWIEFAYHSKYWNPYKNILLSKYVKFDE